MADKLIEPGEIPTLDDVHFEELEAAVRKIRSHASSVERRGGEIDGTWAVGTGLYYFVPNGAVLSEKMIPVKQHASNVAEAAHTAAGALQGYASSGAPIKRSLKQLKRDAANLVARAKALGEDWRKKQDLVEENDRIKSAVRSKVAAHDEAEQTAIDKINATNDGPGTNWAEQGRQYLGFGGFGTTGIGAATGWRTQYKYGRFAPQGYYANGRYGFYKVNGTPLWKNTWRRMQSKNWIAKPYRAGMRNKWLTVGKWGGRVSVGTTVVTSGLSQWGSDAQDKNISTEKRVARTGTKAAVTAGGALVGAKAGALAGGAVGAALGPAGAPVGAVVGGLVGAAAGSGVGSEIADGVNGWIGR